MVWQAASQVPRRVVADPGSHSLRPSAPPNIGATGIVPQLEPLPRSEGALFEPVERELPVVQTGVRVAFGTPWENGYVESFNGNVRDELLTVEILDTVLEAKVLIERSRVE